MAIEPARAFRCVWPADSRDPPPIHECGLLLHEALETSELLRYARRLWRTSRTHLDFLLELPRSRRHLAVSLVAEYAAGTPVTLVEGEVTELPHRLTARELEVLTLVAAGHSNPIIAEALFTSPRTVSTQVEAIRGKLGAVSRTAAGVLAVQNGWLKLPMPVPTKLLDTLDIAELLRQDDQGASAMVTRKPNYIMKPPRPIRLGLAYPAAGPSKSDGTQSRRGATLSIEELNGRGGVHGRPIEAVLVDADIYSEAGVRRTFAELRVREVHAVLMSYVFDEAATFVCAAQLGVPVLHTMTSRKHLEMVREAPERHRAIFQCAPAESNYGPGLVRFLDLLEASSRPHHRTIHFVETVADSGQIADPHTLGLLTGRGWVSFGVDTLTPNAESVERLAEKILLRPPTVLVVTEFLPNTLAALLLRLRTAGCPSLIYTIYTPSMPEFIEAMGDAAEGIVWATVSGTYNDPYGAKFRRTYAARYGNLPGLSQAGLAYDMVHMIAAAWQQVSDPSDVTGTLTALRDTRYRGVNGSYHFASGLQSTVAYPEETNDTSLGNAQLIFQVQGSVHRCLSPAPYDDGEFLWPDRPDQRAV